MFTFTAPSPGFQTATMLPNPEWGDSESALLDLNLKKSIDGTTRTYVKRKGRRKLSWTFTVTRNKAMEVREFMRVYQSSEIGVTDQNGRFWLGYVMNNPVEITMDKRGNPPRQGLPQGELCSFTIEFEGVQVGEDPRAPKIFLPSATSQLELSQGIGVDMGLPNIAGVAYNWDATTITGVSNGAKLSSWADAGPYNVPLIPRPNSDVFGGLDPTLDMSPEYYTGIFGVFPGVYFGNASGSLFTTNMAMWSNTDNVSLFPSRRGTVFFVHQHTVGDPECTGGLRWSQSSVEFGLWSMKIASQNLPTESFNVAGGAHGFNPATWRMQPEDTSVYPTIGPDDGTLPYLVRGRPYVHMIQRNTDTTVRWRVNGVEMDGRTVPNNAGSVGRLRLCQNSEGVTGYTAVLRGFFGHFLVYNRALYESEIETVENYLRTKWSVPDRLWEPEEEKFSDFCITYPHWCGWNKLGEPYEGFEEDCPGVDI